MGTHAAVVPCAVHEVGPLLMSGRGAASQSLGRDSASPLEARATGPQANDAIEGTVGRGTAVGTSTGCVEAAGWTEGDRDRHRVPVGCSAVSTGAAAASLQASVRASWAAESGVHWSSEEATASRTLVGGRASKVADVSKDGETSIAASCAVVVVARVGEPTSRACDGV